MADNQPLQPSSLEPNKEPIVTSSPKKHKFGIVSEILLFIAAPALAVFLTLFVIRSYQVDGPSMMQTLQNNDLLIVNKLPRTWARITHHEFVPNRYQIIIFNKEEGVGQEGRQLVKRVIGLPGERVVVDNGKITVYNKEHPNGFNPDEGQSYSKTIQTTPGNRDVTLGPDEIFVCGDNRVNSLDSRYFGPIKLNEVVGELAVRIFPLNQIRTF